MVKEITDKIFKEEVIESDNIVVVDFWAPWCGPCKMLGPVMEEVEKELGESSHFVKVNVDENPVSSQTYSVSSIPTVLIFKNGSVINKMVGFRPKNDVMDWVKSSL